jgi:hypothetical protein
VSLPLDTSRWRSVLSSACRGPVSGRGSRSSLQTIIRLRYCSELAVLAYGVGITAQSPTRRLSLRQ